MNYYIILLNAHHILHYGEEASVQLARLELSRTINTTDHLFADRQHTNISLDPASTA